MQAVAAVWPRVQTTDLEAKISPGGKASGASTPVAKGLKRKATDTRPGAPTPATEDSKIEASGNKGSKAPVAKDLKRKATDTRPGASTPATEDSKIEASGNKGSKAPVAKDLKKKATDTRPGAPTPATEDSKIEASGNKGSKAPVAKDLKTKAIETRPGASTPATEDSKIEASGKKGRKAPVAKDLKRKATETRPGASTPATEDSKIEASGNKGRTAPVAKDLKTKAIETRPGASTPVKVKSTPGNKAPGNTSIKGDKTKETEAGSTPDSKENKPHVQAGAAVWPHVRNTLEEGIGGEASVGKIITRKVTETRHGASTPVYKASESKDSATKNKTQRVKSEVKIPETIVSTDFSILPVTQQSALKENCWADVTKKCLPPVKKMKQVQKKSLKVIETETSEEYSLEEEIFTAFPVPQLIGQTSQEVVIP
ncbi:microtubule-associated protein futsch-like [Penaeus chinensis]|uniref:microtubule-associated protein futsch-like n=1 Tax=Penaeus chinensis TaxID=139456 RepID=UPI001FB6B133|nr:microtubule-associated protein futsch-like [Penaeus chinensis]